MGATALGGTRAVGYRLRETRKQRGWTLKQLAEETGASASDLASMEHGRVRTSLRTAVRAARALRISLDYITGVTDEPRSQDELLDELQKRDRDLQAIKTAYVEDNLVTIADLESRAASCPAAGDDDAPLKTSFTWRWMCNHGLQPDRCRIMRVNEAAMEPTLPHGAAVLIDLRQRRRRGNGIFVVRLGDETVIRRTIRDHNKGWMLVSDNTDKATWATRRWPEKAEIVGEVKWMGATLI